jgi:cytochrome c oxidase cbb3-type subunit 3
MLNDQSGERLLPIVRGARATTGMPALDLPDDDVVAVALYVHSVLATARPQGAPPAGAELALNVLVGDASAGASYFNEACSRCHSTTGDLSGIGTRVADPMQLQNLWVGGGRDDRIRTWDDPPSRRDVIAKVVPANGPAVEGRLDRIDDFTVTVVLADGTRRTLRRAGDVPRIEIADPLAAHKQLLQTYTDGDIHNVTAYLVTLK